MYVFSEFLNTVHEYVCEEAKRDATILDNVLKYPYTSKLKRFARRFLVGRVPLRARTLLSLLECGEKERIGLRKIDREDRVLIFDIHNPRIFKAFLNLLPKGLRIYVYFSNPIERVFKSPENALRKLRRMGAIDCSFDPHDAAKYGMRMAGQYFFTPPCNISVCIYDNYNTPAFFCGLKKDRAEKITQIQSFLQGKGVVCDFYVPEKDNEQINFKKEYLPRLGRAGIVVDINQKGQTGLTRRPIEALLWNKKLVTDNKDIVNYDFYRPENVFVYGVDAPDSFERFIKTPLVEVPETIKSRYTVAGWLKQFSE